MKAFVHETAKTLTPAVFVLTIEVQGENTPLHLAGTMVEITIIDDIADEAPPVSPVQHRDAIFIQKGQLPCS